MKGRAYKSHRYSGNIENKVTNVSFMLMHGIDMHILNKIPYSKWCN